MSKTSSVLKFAVVAVVAFAGGALATSIANATTEQQNPYYVLDQLARVLVRIENDYVDPVDRSRLIEGAIKGMVAELDPHSSFLPREDYAIFQGDTQGRFGGVGVEVDFGNDSVTVMSVVEGSPAEQRGIAPGDQIIAIDGHPVRGKSAADLVRTMRGEPGSKVSLSLRRKSHEGLLTLTLVRRIITVSSVASKLLNEGVGYLRIKSFQSGTHTEFQEALGKLREANGDELSALILDLRNNPGGLVDEASAIADEFLDGGVIYTTRHRREIVDEVTASSGGSVKRGPIAVLVNEYSASASELLAGALQDQHRGAIIGAKTFGKGSVQSILDLPGGDGLRITTMRYYTPSGRAIQALGITPDVLVPTPFEDVDDIVRESDLEGHLAAEGKRPPPKAPPPPSQNETPPGKAHDPSETLLGVARITPVNPLTGPDQALKVAYETLTGRRGSQGK